MPKVSVIIPVYNTAKYSEECLESVIRQTFTDLEIICINDGSIDSSLHILEKFATLDSRIVIIDQKNQGVSAARNAGLKIAKGKYVGFVDSDDTVTPDYFQTLYETAEQTRSDLVFSKLENKNDGLEKNRVYDRSEILQIILPTYFNGDLLNSIWNKLYLNEIITAHQIRFLPGKKLGEDALFNLQFLEFTYKMYYIDYSGYHYRTVNGSATRNVFVQKYLEDAVEFFLEGPGNFVKENINYQKLQQLKSTRFVNYTMSLVYIYSEPKNGLNIFQKVEKIRILVNNETVSTVFNETDIAKLFPSFGPYQNQVFKSIGRKNVLKLYLFSLYSYLRNL
ncbi:glycosyltransferase [Kaistella sp. G5-32]|uniref:Glycosyltransferase n=1 Tax=Kaistella gelatinilytica TaxID=2787636 RepID=A0ABS0FC83_9FLAO|nr:glycosyltransferase [Kaistella gelatinilytica]MBF8457260.1 glycosyltransferase [Kaistella gelatinilytica]